MKRRTPFSYEWLSARIVEREVRAVARQYGSGDILDVGCGEKPYRPLFEHARRYVGLEHPGTLHARNSVDVFGSAESLPFKDRVFDVVLCFEVLEHLPDPARALKEMHRVLRQDGHCIVFVPFIFHLHEHPRDYFRYTPFGIAELFERSGLEAVSVTANSGVWATMAILFVNYLEKFSHGSLAGPFVRALIAVVQLSAVLLEALSSRFQRTDRVERFSFHYVAIGRARRGR